MKNKSPPNFILNLQENKSKCHLGRKVGKYGDRYDCLKPQRRGRAERKNSPKMQRKATMLHGVKVSPQGVGNPDTHPCFVLLSLVLVQDQFRQTDNIVQIQYIKFVQNDY